MARKKVRIVHIINSFEFGGAEAMLCNLLLRCDRSRFEPYAISLIDDLSVAGPILNAGIPVQVIGMRPGIPDPRGLIRLVRHVRQLRPDVVQTWMDHSNLIGGVATRLASRAPVVWGVHHSHHVRKLTKRSTLWTVAACGMLSRRLPARIVFCSRHSQRLYRDEHGFDVERMMDIPNGFDTARFRPDLAARIAIRRELGIDPAQPLIGLAARYDPMKDHATFLRAAAHLLTTRPDTHFVLCGDRVDASNLALTALLAQLGIKERCHLLGPRNDVSRIFAALDVGASSSISEACPLVVGEMMACAVPCAVTQVGDSARLVGSTGRVVPPSDPVALAAAWADLLAISPEARQRLGEAARQRICEQFDLSVVVKLYEALYLEVSSVRSFTPTMPCLSAVPGL